MSGIFTSVFERREMRTLDERTGAGLLSRGLGAYDTAAGVLVSPLRAMQNSAVFACIRILGESVASLPLPVYRRLAQGGKIKAPDHYLYPILHDIANPEQTAFEVRELQMTHLNLRGNSYNYLDLDRAGRISSVWPLNPDQVSILREALTNKLYYGVELPEAFGREYRIISAEQMWHIRGLSYDGLIGLSPIQLQRQAVGLALATEEYGARFFGNGAQPGFVLKHPSSLKEAAYNRLKEAWEKRHTGLENSHRIAILEEGMSVEKLGVSPEEAQFLQTRKFQTTEIARIFRIPPHMIADLEKATFSNIEQQSIEFVVHSLRPWLIRYEQSIFKDLLTPSERSTFYAQFVVNGLLRGDINSRYQAYHLAKTDGWMSSDDIRELEDMNPLPGGSGKIYLVPLNMIPADSLVGSSQPAPAAGGQRFAFIDELGEIKLLPAGNPEPVNRQAPASSPLKTVAAEGGREIRQAQYTGAMIAFMIPIDEGIRLALDPAELPEGFDPIPADVLHITLAYLGDTTGLKIDRAALSDALAMFARKHAPITGRVNGIGRFKTNDPAGDALYASFDSPDLPAFRQDLIAALAELEVDPASDHGFIPHITLTYLPAGAETPAIEIPELEITFGEITLAWAEQLDNYPLGSSARGLAPASEDRRDPAELEERTRQAAASRHRLQIAYKRVFSDVAGRIARREASDILAQARKSFKGRGFSDFMAWLESFYRDHLEFIQRQWLPVALAYAELVAGEAAQEVSAKSEDYSPKLEKFMRTYVNYFAQRQVNKNQERIKKVLSKAQAAGSDPLVDLEADLGEWETNAPESIAQDESVEANNAVAKMVYTAAGIITIRSVSFGKSCPYCVSLDGRVVGIEEKFLSAGDAFQPDGADRPLTPAYDRAHPPYHGGCDCMIMAGIG